MLFERYLREVLRRYPRVLGFARRLRVSLGGRDTRRVLTRARRLRKQGRLPRARRMLVRTWRSGRAGPRVAAELAMIAQDSGQWDEAVVWWRRRFQQCRQVPAPDEYLAYARVCFWTGDSAHASRLLEQGIARHPKALKLRVAWAEQAMSSRRWRAAVTRWNRLFEEHPRAVPRKYQRRRRIARDTRTWCALDSGEDTEDFADRVLAWKHAVRVKSDTRLVKRLSHVLAALDDHESYQRLLRLHDPELAPLDSRETVLDRQFIGEGYGRGVLNVYRRMILSERGRSAAVTRFEKIYFCDAEEYTRIRAFRDWFPSAAGNAAPPIVALSEGQRLAAVYWDYLSPSDSSVDFNAEHGLALALDLCLQVNGSIQLSSNDPSVDVALTASGNRLLRRFPEARGLIERHLEARQGPPGRPESDVVDEWHAVAGHINGYEKRISELPLVASHGDINPRNILLVNGRPCLIDWDYWGFLPPGYDLARIIRYSGIRDLDVVLGYVNRYVDRMGMDSMRDEITVAVIWYLLHFVAYAELSKKGQPGMKRMSFIYRMIAWLARYG